MYFIHEKMLHFAKTVSFDNHLAADCDIRYHMSDNVIHCIKNTCEINAYLLGNKELGHLHVNNYGNITQIIKGN